MILPLDIVPPSPYDSGCVVGKARVEEIHTDSVVQRTERVPVVGPPRDPNSQVLHDNVITKIALSGVNAERYHAGTNRGRDHDWPIRYVELDGSLYPDLVIMNRRSGRIEGLYEVETDESVNEEHAKLEWKPYSSMGWKFMLVVPKSKLSEALGLIEDQRIRVDHVGTYETNSLGTIELNLPRLI